MSRRNRPTSPLQRDNEHQRRLWHQRQREAAQRQIDALLEQFASDGDDDTDAHDDEQAAS